MGAYCYLGVNSKVWSGAEIAIGDRVLIAHNVTIMDNLTHPLDATQRHQHFKDIISKGHPVTIDLDDRPVRIEDDVWIGCNCVVTRGVSIGKGAVVAAGSVVTKDVPAFTLVAGNPAREIRRLDQ
jgi:acetyltransferase-like isoleucine patch superfamily enzyme